MNSQFHFKGFDPDLRLRTHANVVLNRLLDRSPYGATAVALLEKNDQGFRCLLDIYSIQGPFITSSVGETALDALNAIEEKMNAKMDLWMNTRLETDNSRPFDNWHFFLGRGRGAA